MSSLLKIESNNIQDNTMMDLFEALCESTKMLKCFFKKYISYIFKWFGRVFFLILDGCFSLQISYYYNLFSSLLQVLLLNI